MPSLHELARIQFRLKGVANPVGFLINLFTHVPVGFAVWRPEGTPLLTNQAFADLFKSEPPPGYNVLKDEMLARSGMLASFQRAFAGETVHVPTVWYDPRELKSFTVSEGRRVAISMTIFPLFKDNGDLDFVAATYKDDTEIMLAHERLQAEDEQLKNLLQQMERDNDERRAMEADRARIEGQLRQAQKMEALGTLSGGIAHDFNNLLSVILGSASLAAGQVPADHPVQENVEEIRRAGTRAANLVRQILAFGRPESPNRSVVAIRPAIEEELRLLRANLPKTIEIKSQFADVLPGITADPGQIHQIMTNLGSNAAYAMGAAGGVLDVRLETIAVSEELARTSSGLHEGHYLRIVVADNGCGIEKDVLPRVFEPFFTTKARGQGSGLGLSVVHGIMKSHKGAVTVYSEPGKGTSFSLYFPVQGPAVAPVAAAAAPAPRGQGEHILLVDDEEALAFLTERILGRQGYRVTSHTDVMQALQDFRRRPQEFAAVVTDYSMPAMSGLDFARRVLEIRPDIPVVLTSGYFRPENVEEAKAVGVRELVLKPNTATEFGATLHRLLHRPAGDGGDGTAKS